MSVLRYSGPRWTRPIARMASRRSIRWPRMASAARTMPPRSWPGEVVGRETPTCMARRGMRAGEATSSVPDRSSHRWLRRVGLGFPERGGVTVRSGAELTGDEGVKRVGVEIRAIRPANRAELAIDADLSEHLGSRNAAKTPSTASRSWTARPSSCWSRARSERWRSARSRPAASRCGERPPCN